MKRKTCKKKCIFQYRRIVQFGPFQQQKSVLNLIVTMDNHFFFFFFFNRPPKTPALIFLQLYTLIEINISLTNQNAASLPNVHTCNNVRVPGGIARGENGIRYPNVTDPSKYTISNDFIFYIE